jgi:hypothetical protein
MTQKWKMWKKNVIHAMQNPLSSPTAYDAIFKLMIIRHTKGTNNNCTTLRKYRISEAKMW